MLGLDSLDELTKALTKIWVSPGELHVGHQPALLRPYVEPASAKLPSVYVLATQERPNPIGQPDFTAASGPDFSKMSEHCGREHISANGDHVRRNFVASWLLFNPCHSEQAPLRFLPHDHTICGDHPFRHPLNGDT